MRTTVLLSIALTSIASVALASSGIKVSNQSAVDIDHLYTSAPGKAVWSSDLLAGEDSIERGKSGAVAQLQPGTYDLKLVDDDDGGKPCIVTHVAVKANSTLTLTKEMTSTCK